MIINSNYRVEALDDKAIALLKRGIATDRVTGEKRES